MSGTVDVLAVLLPEVDGDEGAATLLMAEAERIASTLGGGSAAVRFVGPEGSDSSAFLDRISGYVGVTRPRTVLMLDGDLSREIAPLLALRMGSAAVIGCTGVAIAEGATSYSKPVYGGWLEQEVGYRAGALEVVTVSRSALSEPPATDGGWEEGDGRIMEVTVSGRGDGDVGPQAGVTRVGLQPPEHRSVDIVFAKRIVAAGMGAFHPGDAGGSPTGASTDPGAERGALLGQMERLADLLEGATAATRPMVDEGLFDKERLVGQTGKKVAPEVYVALGISGSPHHIAGIQGAGTILAVDRDTAAPIFQFSDAGFVGDLREVLPALIRRIEEWRDGD